MKKIEIEEQKKLQLDMLKNIKQICDKNEITYFLGGGTLLGAVRHKGYIPWDDDIDIMLPREDYNKLLSIFNSQANKDYKILSYTNCEDYYYPFAKIVNVKTKLIEKKYETIDMMGVFIDVFPIDYLPNSKIKIKKLFFDYKVCFWLTNCYKQNIAYMESLKLNKIIKIIKKIIKIFITKFKLIKKILKNIDKICTKNKDTNTVACITGIYYEREVMDKSYMDDYVMVDFEDEQYKAPIGYKDYLTKHYGDYMKLPPKEKQIPGHRTEVYWRDL